MQEHRLVTTRRARYYTIGGGTQPLAESWIVLHGLGQLASVFITYFQSIDTPDRLVVAPEALNRHYMMPEGGGSSRDAKVGATWMTRQDRENEIADYVDYLDAVWRETGGASRVTVLGFSQGVATAARWIAMGKSRIDRFVAWAGQIPPDVDPSAFTKLSEGITIVTGSTDEYASWVADGDHVGRLAAVGITPRFLTFEGGHRMDRVTLEGIAGP